MAESDANMLAIDAAEAGQKLLRLLERRTGLAQALLQRWLRTGQIRRNGRRAKPFERIEAGDFIRLPPFAQKIIQSDHSDLPAQARLQTAASLPPLPPLLGSHAGILAFHKPAGLAVQAGSGITVNLAAQLAAHYADAAFAPAPAHRLDRETSGVILCATTFQALRNLHQWQKSGAIRKEYLAWCQGAWPYANSTLFRHYLREENGNVSAHTEPPGREAALLARPLRAAANRSLLQILLLTGRKRQIRAQLAALGHAICGDARYGAPRGAILRLHALRVTLPDGHEFACLPSWQGKFMVATVPESMRAPGAPA